MEQIRAMLDEMSKNTGFDEEIQALLKSRDTAAIVAAAGARGFVFSAAEWREYLDWSDSLAVIGQSGEIPPEELENVSGGFKGTATDPFIGDCWFHAGSEAENRNGHMRKRCNQFACKTRPIFKAYYQCGCWGTDKCVDSWHYAEGCSS